ncbi:MAG: AMP-binding protein, partial [Dehalococcoidia bacterium]|nr:AMP-binding protein [Dehalococcoidia bacterium]
MEQKTLSSMMHEKRVFYPPAELSKKAYIKSLEEYKEIYQRSLDDPEAFWGEAAQQLDWYKKWDNVLVEDFKEAKHEWFVGGKLNVSYNCLDRNLKTWRKNKAALIWEGDTGDTKTLTYQELYYNVCKFANVLKKHGIKKGDRVSIYLPMILELPIAMLACARIGAIHSVVFGGFSAEALRNRILDCDSKMLICVDGYYRSGRIIRSKDNADEALKECPAVKDVIVVRRAGIQV